MKHSNEEVVGALIVIGAVFVLGLVIVYSIWVLIAWLFAIAFGWTYNIWIVGLLGFISHNLLKSIFKSKK